VTATAAEIVRTAARWINRGTRLDMSALATEFGISRTTLFRRVGNRDDLMGDALWSLSDRTLRVAVQQWNAERGTEVRGPDGELRCLWVMRRYRSAIADNLGMRKLLADEPAVALRVLTDPDGRVQPKVIVAHEELLSRDVADGGFVPVVDIRTLSWAIVRLGEAFLYADVMAGGVSDLSAASTLLAALVEAHVPAPETAV
jgi:AcrR family transcriptional regulator